MSASFTACGFHRRGMLESSCYLAGGIPNTTTDHASSDPNLPSNVQAAESSEGSSSQDQQLQNIEGVPEESYPRRRNTEKFTVEELSEALPNDESELREAFNRIKDKFLEQRQSNGLKYLTEQRIERIIGIKNETIKANDANEKHQALRSFTIKTGGPLGLTLVRLAGKANGDESISVSGYVAPTEKWFDVLSLAHSSLHSGRLTGRDQTMIKVRELGFDNNIPKELFQAYILRCPDPGCRAKSRLAVCQTKHRAGSSNGAPPSRPAVSRARRQHKEDVRSQRAAAEAAPAQPAPEESWWVQDAPPSQMLWQTQQQPAIAPSNPIHPTPFQQNGQGWFEEDPNALIHPTILAMSPYYPIHPNPPPQNGQGWFGKDPNALVHPMPLAESPSHPTHHTLPTQNGQGLIWDGPNAYVNPTPLAMPPPHSTYPNPLRQNGQGGFGEDLNAAVYPTSHTPLFSSEGAEGQAAEELAEVSLNAESDGAFDAGFDCTDFSGWEDGLGGDWPSQ